MVEINIHLFGKPEWEMDLEKADAEAFRLLGEDIKERLKRISEIIVKLEKNGWDRSAGLYDIMYYKKIKLDQAKDELKKLEIGEDEVNLEDFDEEEFDEDLEEEIENEDENNFTKDKWVKKKLLKINNSK